MNHQKTTYKKQNVSNPIRESQNYEISKTIWFVPTVSNPIRESQNSQKGSTNAIKIGFKPYKGKSK